MIQDLKVPIWKLKRWNSNVLKWNKCKLETVSYGHGITTTPLQAASIYASLVNGGKIINPKLVKKT